jgi:hypothetical protein
MPFLAVWANYIEAVIRRKKGEKVLWEQEFILKSWQNLLDHCVSCWPGQKVGLRPAI